ncbi:MAG: phospholipid carrier-dependent glycosyltransferase, partial [Desulfobacterales bacterium]
MINSTIQTPWFKALMAGLLVLLIASIVVLAAVPPVSRDALTHHLAVPKLYLQYGGLVEIPEIQFSYFPMNLDLLYLLPLYFGNDILPKYIHFIFGLMTAWLIYTYLRDRTGQNGYGLMGALLFLSLPVIIKLSITVYVDLGLVFFSTAALLSLLKWAASGFKLRYLLIGAIACGLALGTKYNGLVTFFLLVCFTPIIYLRGRSYHLANSGSQPARDERQRGSALMISVRAIGMTALFAGVALLVFSPWMLRNYHWTGNPIYPLYKGVFKSSDQPSSDQSTLENAPTADAEKTKSAGPTSHFVIRRIVFHETFFETMLIPIRVFFQGQDDNPRLFDGRLNPYLFFLPLIAFIGIRQREQRYRIEDSLFLIFSILFLLYSFFSAVMRIRYIAPIIPPLVILTVIGLEWLISIIRQAPRRIYQVLSLILVIGPVCFLLALNGNYLLKQFELVRPFDYLGGRVDRDSYITRHRGEYPAMQFINAHLPVDAQVLAVFLGNRIYYSDRCMYNNDGLLKKSILAAESADALAESLQVHGYSHLLIQFGFFKQYVLDHMSNEQRLVFSRFLKSRAQELFSDRGYHVYALTDIQSGPVVQNKAIQ